MPIIKGLDKLVKYNDRSLKDLTTTPTAAGGGGTGALVHIKTLTASSSATLSFVDGSSDVVLDNTYPIYKFEFINIHPATDSQPFTFQGSIDGGSNYNTTMTNTLFRAYNYENNSATSLEYRDVDQAQGTAFQAITDNVGADNDQCCNGTAFLFAPSSTTFVKHFMFRMAEVNGGDVIVDMYTAGYFNTTSAVDAIQFKFASGNIDAGKIKLYGILDS